MNDHTIFPAQDIQIIKSDKPFDFQRKNSLLDFEIRGNSKGSSLKGSLKERLVLSKDYHSQRKNLFSLFLYVVIFTNYDTGVIPAALLQIEEEMSLNFTQQALLGSLPNFGISFASFFVSPLIKKFTAKSVLSVSLFLNIGFCALFSLSKNLWALYFSRFFMGFTQAFWVIYGPVWTNNFSPKDRQTTWLGLLQGFSPLGIIFGYFVTGLVINFWTVSYSWRLSIIIQGVLEFIPLIIFQAFKNVEIDIIEYKLQMQSNEANEDFLNNEENSLWSQTKKVLSNEVFLLSSFAICVAFFVVYGIQFWGTYYMIQTMEITGYEAMIYYFIITITAPILGVLFGGHLLDQMGGYKGDNKVCALKMCLLFTTLCVIIAIPAGFVYHVYIFAPLLWLQIFFGACVIPPGTGLVVDSVEEFFILFLS